MKRLFVYVLLLLLFAAGCGKTGETPEAPALTAALDGSPNLNWDTQGRFLTIAATDAWTVSVAYPADAPAGWCTPAPAAGEGNKNVWLATTANSSTVPRHATVTVATAKESLALEIAQGGAGDAPLPDVSNRLELPGVEDEQWLLHYAAGEFTIEYSPAKKHPKWVAWKLYKSHMGSSGRTDAWQWDARIPEADRPLRDDFRGYDRGHLCPSGDRTQSTEMNAQTFMYSNMSPQIAAFNQGIWVTLEDKERTWAGGQDTLYICAGGTILKESDIMSYTAPSAMAVPKYYFKVILRKKAATGAYDAIGFWFENRSYAGTPLSPAQAKSVDDIETLTGLDFFHALPAAIQNQAEAAFNPSAWGIN